VKSRWKIITLPEDIEALKAQGKYREHLPHWVRDGDSIWSVASEFYKWKADKVELERMSVGNIL
jgi:hypothetical protein